jgi:hypothetical protein
MDRFGNTKLAGELTVTGGGLFSTDNGATGARVEIGGRDGLIMWAGSGPRNFNTGKFMIDAEGNVFIRGLPLTVPSAAGGDSVNFTVIPQAGQPTAKCLILAHCVAYESGSGTGDADLKDFVTEIVVNGQAVQGVLIEQMRLESMPVTITHIGDYAGTITIQVRVTSVRGAEVSLRNTNIILLQVQGGT